MARPAFLQRLRPGQFLSGRVVIALVGFALSVVGALGGDLYVAPARRTLEALKRETTTLEARARAIRDAAAFDATAGELGVLVFGIGDVPDAAAATIRDLRRRTLEHRHDGVRAYIAELAAAGAVAFEPTSRRFEALAEAERRAFTRETYGAVNTFEEELTMAMIEIEGAATLKAIRLRPSVAAAKTVLREREATLVLVSLCGAALVFVAAMAQARKTPAPAPGRARLLAAALARLEADGARS